jgi:DNA-binding beta-propeller fold protein YncE
VFTVEGKYLSQVLINPDGPTQHSAVAVALSPDRGQRFLYVGDFGNSQILTVDRKALKVLGFFGSKGSDPGQFNGLHDVAIDSKGNLYTAEVNPGARFQKFVPADAN